MEALQGKLRNIPPVDRLLAAAEGSELAGLPHGLLVGVLRQAVEAVRGCLLAGGEADLSPAAILERARVLAAAAAAPSLRRVVNATGVVLHTNLGRAPLSARARERVTAVMDGYSTLEYDAASGERGSRYAHVAGRLAALVGAEAVLAVNNNAAAVLLVLSALAAGREVIVSRGQLVEIGGSFRVPEVMAQSGATLVEVGTTNKTRLADYELAVGERTAAILKVHTSNYRIVGFTAQPEDAELAALAGRYKLPLIEDLGSGTLLPIAADGWREPPVGERLAAGMDVVTFSGDKLFGGGQAGIIAGRAELLERMAQHPLLRAVRIDKLSLAALEGTLLDYTVGRPTEDIPVQAMLNADPAALEARAGRLAAALAAVAGWQVEKVATIAQAGGGALPAVELASWGVRVRAAGLSAAAVERGLRLRPTPVVARVQEDSVVFDVRCLADGDMAEIARAIAGLTAGGRP